MEGMVQDIVRNNRAKSAAGYDSLGADQRRVFDDNLQMHHRQTYEACAKDSRSDRCANHREIRAKQEMNRNKEGYYSGQMSPEE